MSSQRVIAGNNALISRFPVLASIPAASRSARPSKSIFPVGLEAAREGFIAESDRRVMPNASSGKRRLPKKA
jgi:hypothetical protein